MHINKHMKVLCTHQRENIKDRICILNARVKQIHNHVLTSLLFFKSCVTATCKKQIETHQIILLSICYFTQHFSENVDTSKLIQIIIECCNYY